MTPCMLCFALLMVFGVADTSRGGLPPSAQALELVQRGASRVQVARRSSLMYGSVIYLQVQLPGNRWLTGARSAGNEDVRTRNRLDGGYEQNQVPATYQWQIRSDAGDGRVSSSDPKAAECVKYGDEVLLQVQWMDSRWLSGGRSAGNEVVVTRNLLDGGYEQNTASWTYRWTATSIADASSGDPMAGQCLQYGDVVFFKLTNDRWLSGGRGSGNEGVLTRDLLDGGYEQNTVPDTYRWQIRSNVGDGTIGSADPLASTTTTTTTTTTTSSTTTTTRTSSEQPVFAEGDPHLQNILGERFDVWKVGTVDLLTHPRKNHHANLNLRVQATISKGTFDWQKNPECHGPVISAVGFGGGWFGHKHVNVSLDMDRFALHVTNADHVNQLAPGMVQITRESEQQINIQIGEAAFSVQAAHGFGRGYLRFVATHLASFDGEVGGLLGFDEHTDVSLAPEGCETQAQAMLRTPTTEFMAVASK